MCCGVLHTKLDVTFFFQVCLYSTVYINFRIRSPVPYSSHSQSSDGGQSSYSSPPEPSHSHAPSSSGGHSSRDKPQVKSESTTKQHWDIISNDAFISVWVASLNSSTYVLFVFPQKLPLWWLKLSKPLRTGFLGGEGTREKAIVSRL